LSDLLEAPTYETDLISSTTDILSINAGDPIADSTPGTDTMHNRYWTRRCKEFMPDCTINVTFSCKVHLNYHEQLCERQNCNWNKRA
jgi:hypothetical protein